ncbi:MAG: hypothetical protein R3F34_00675 [Planctomycetota bacterium]
MLRTIRFAPVLTAAFLLAAPIKLAAAPRDTQTYGCGSNPSGSLTVLSGDAVLGTTVTIGLDNPLGTQAPGSIPVLFLSATADPAYPCGQPAYGLSMFGPAQAGELLVDVFGPGLLAISIGAPWAGPGSPSAFPVALPVLPFLVGKTIYAQGAIVDPTSSTVAIGATEGLRLTLEQPVTVATPVVTVTSDDRRASVQTYGFDWEYDDGESALVEHDLGTSTFEAEPAILDKDWWGYPVAAGSASHDSTMGARLLRCSFECTTQTFGNHFSEDASSSAEAHVAFTTTDRVRFTAQAQGTITYGYNEVTVALRGAPGTVFSIGAYQGQDDQDAALGWLQPGAYVLDAEAIAMAYGNNGHAEVQSASLELEIRIFHQADHETDGDVDQDDFDAFHQDLAAGSPFADIDGNGVTDAADGALFDAVWADAR